ncbi:MAG TPA: hypothetical protein VNT58_10465 [Gaiellaceae bacterium]|nr:hypothetical protein [Gaiellaceae bacterium]
MHGATIRIGGLDGLVRFVRGLAKMTRGFAFATALAVAVIASAFARDGFGALDGIVTLVLLAPPTVLLLFSLGLGQVARLPERLRRMPNEGGEQLRELTAIAGEARRSGVRRLPRLLWRLRGVVGSSRDLLGFAVPLRVFTPPFLALTAVSAFLSLVLIGGGLVALVVIALT